MNKVETFLLWDCNECESKNMNFVHQISEKLKLQINGIVIYTKNSEFIPLDATDLALIMPLNIRFGEYAFYDAILDIISFTKTKKGRFNIVLVANSLPLWITLFQKLTPRELIFISSENPENTLDFSFLPNSIKTKTLQWPNLSTISQNIDNLSDESNPQSPSSVHSKSSQIASTKPQKSLKSSKISRNSKALKPKATETQKPIKNSIIQPQYPKETIKETQKDFNKDDDVSNSEEEEIMSYNQNLSQSSQLSVKQANKKQEKDYQTQIPVPKAIQQTSKANPGEQTFTVPIKFQPLIEAMRAAGKAMISMNDLEGHLKTAAAHLNIQQPNTNTIVNKANDAGFIIYDKSIKYVRFRNRQMTTGIINYV